MSKKSNIMSLSLEPDIQEKLKMHAKQKTDGNVSKLVRDMVEKYLFCEDEVIPVILKIPAKHRGDEQGLRKWLETKSAAIVKALSG